MDLIETLRSPEGKTLEFKRDLSSTDPFKRTVVAFANTAGGTILILGSLVGKWLRLSDSV